MPQYFYTAKSFKGEIETGTLEAGTKKELSKILHQEGYVLIRAEAELEIKDKKNKFEISLSFFGKVSLTEKMMFTRNLRVMVSAGVSLPRSLSILSTQSKNPKFKKALAEILEAVNKGKSLSESLKKYPEIFSELFVSMIKAGEESGTLENVLKNLAYQMEKEHDLRSKIIGAMVYPAVIIFAMVGIGVLMLIMVIPKLAETFRELEIDLPLTTRFVIGLGEFLATKWYLFLIIVFVLFFLLKNALKTKRGKKILDSITLKIPIISPIIKKTNSAQTLRTLSSLIVSGIPLVRALRIVSGSLGNIYFKEAMISAIEKIQKGEKLSLALTPYQDLYPPMVIQMIEIGEETGQTSEILAKLADFYEEEVTNHTKNLSAIMEPLLMLLVGGAVGFFAISMIQPMYSMLGAIQ
ncbi:MAG TPA: type II secretion system F family protein [Candidatus Nealsonbacteria bacterium]|uniref:Type II secretion system protein GspF domain-containing protein n=1 Tax=marine sediment metagenome TaxID=412755 RepID=A0A0F9XXQ0_9ZZZZ|nr:type II secretion system F family protein [Candidatus Nealsonbacteria bacterium]HEB46469.1 type II secretion system F family protein [Candidatus Nealsonbacteria bacterium]